MTARAPQNTQPPLFQHTLMQRTLWGSGKSKRDESRIFLPFSISSRLWAHFHFLPHKHRSRYHAFDSDLFPVIYSPVRKERGAWGKKWLKERQENAENSSKSAPGSPAAAYPAFKNSFRPRLARIVHLCEQDYFDHTNQPSRGSFGTQSHLLTDMLTAER